MAKNELVALSLVYKKPMHVYALKNVVGHIGLEEWGKISTASIYNNLSRLEREGCVKVSMKKVGNMPERKVYAITGKGRHRLKQEFKEALMESNTGDNPTNIAVTFGLGLSTREIIQCLYQKIEKLKDSLQYVNTKFHHLKKYKIHNATILLSAAEKHMHIDIEMTRQLIRLLKREPGYFSRYWKQLHEAGPPEECAGSIHLSQKENKP